MRIVFGVLTVLSLWACDPGSYGDNGSGYYQNQTDICPSGFPASEGTYDLTVGDMKVTLPIAAFDEGTPQITVAEFDVDEKIELTLDTNVAILDFDQGIQQGLISNPSNNITVTRGSTGWVHGVGCNGPGNFQWDFQRPADELILIRDPNNSAGYNFQLLFKRDPDAFEGTYDYNITGSFTIH